MKTYIKPIIDIVGIATNEVMTTGMSETAIPIIPDTNGDNIIYNGNEVLGNENRVWDTLNNGF